MCQLICCFTQAKYLWKNLKTLVRLDPITFQCFVHSTLIFKTTIRKNEVEEEEEGDSEKADELIKEGKKTNGDREAVASE